MPGFASFVLAILSALTALPSIASEDVFTVRDSILMRRLTSLEGNAWLRPQDGVSLYSPGGRYLLARTRQGDIEHDENIDRLLIWSTDAVRHWLESGGRTAPPEPRVLVKHHFRDDWASMSGVRWLDDREVGFIARADDGFQQAFAIEAESGKSVQLTHAQSDVVSFAAVKDRIVYFARRTLPSGSMMTLGPNGIGGLLDRRPGDSRSDVSELFITSRSQDAPRRVDAPPIFVMEDRIWISPNGDYAITVTAAVDAPAHWAGYRVYDNKNRGWTAQWVSSDSTSFDLVDRQRYQWVDLRNATVRPLIDAPDGALSFARASHAAFWSSNSQYVIVAQTYLSLSGVSTKERALRTRGPAVAAVDLRTGKAEAITWIRFATSEERKAGAQSEEILGMEWDEKREIFSITRQSAGHDAVTERYVRSGLSWKMQTIAADTAHQLPAVKRQEGPNKRPKLVIAAESCRCERELFDPAPDMDRFVFGHQELLKWTDSERHEWKGMLIYPVGYTAGKRYPFVLQTHGSSERQFVVDGPSGVTTAFAAQPLAASGAVVLQAGESRLAITEDANEGRNVAIGWKAVIDLLDNRGIIDSQKVGIIGWSRTGYHAAVMMAQYPDSIAAVTISDAIQYNYTQSLFAVGSQSAMNSVTRALGEPAVEVGYGKWFEQNPFYGMTKSNAALRVEALNNGSLLAMWETYALRMQAGKPADLVYFPQGSHVLLKPSERLGSQQGNVDWFRFWLQGYEDPAPEKREQYRRWRRLKGR